MRKRRQKQPLSTSEQLIIGLSLVFLTLSLSTISIIFFAMKPKIDRDHMMSAVAKKEAQLTTVSQVDTYHGETTYYSVFGENPENQSLAVIIGEKNKDIHIVSLKEGISRQQAKKMAKTVDKGINKVTLGFFDEKPVWEASSGTSFYLLDFKTGDLLKTEGL